LDLFLKINIFIGMLTYLKKLFMAFNASNVNIISSQKQPELPAVVTHSIDLSKQEIEFLLTLIKNSTFSGNMVELIYDLAYKLQEYHSKINQ